MNMTTLELRAGIFETLNQMLDNEEALKQVNSYLLRLQKKMQKEQQTAALRPYTIEELHARADEAMAEIEAGEVMTSEEVFAEMEHKYPWLCK